MQAPAQADRFSELRLLLQPVGNRPQERAPVAEDAS